MDTSGYGDRYDVCVPLMEFDPQNIIDAAKYAAYKYCPKDYLKEDAASAAMLKIVERISSYNPDKSSKKTFLIQQARYGVSEFLRQECGQIRRDGRKIDLTICNEYEDTHIGNSVSADTQLDIARRLDNTEKVPDPTLAQWRGNIPELKTLRRRCGQEKVIRGS